MSDSLLSIDAFRELARRNDIRIFVILPFFYNPEVLHKTPDLYAITATGEKAVEEWVEFVCPTREDYRKQRIALIKDIIREFDPDGISIDFIRYFVFWEKIYPERTLDSMVNTCFDSYCLDKFQKETGIRIPQRLASVPEKSEWILQNHRLEWTAWKCEVIASMVREIAQEERKIKPEVLINIHAVPWRDRDFGGAIKIVAGQDLAAISEHTDFISPMC